MKRTFYLIPLIFILGCAKEPPQRNGYLLKQKEVTSTKTNNVFNASFSDVWPATLQGLNWLKWDAAYTDIGDGNIRLKEAYIYRKSGKLFRNYRWPSKEEVKVSNIDDYAEKIAKYGKNILNSDPPVFSQESMTIKVIKLSESKTKVDISYKIKLYLNSGKFASEVTSSGYIESLLLEKIRERLNGKPLSYANKIGGKNSN